MAPILTLEEFRKLVTKNTESETVSAPEPDQCEHAWISVANVSRGNLQRCLRCRTHKITAPSGKETIYGKEACL